MSVLAWVTHSSVRCTSKDKTVTLVSFQSEILGQAGQSPVITFGVEKSGIHVGSRGMECKLQKPNGCEISCELPNLQSLSLLSRSLHKWFTQISSRLMNTVVRRGERFERVA